MRSLLPVYGIVLVVFAAACLYLFKIGLDDYVASQSLSSVAVAPAAGWEARPYTTADGELITASAFDEAAPSGATTQDILRRFAAAATGQNHSTATTFYRGNERIALSLQFALHAPQRKTMRERLGYAAPAAPPPPDPSTIIATIFGVPFIEHPREASIPGQSGVEPVNYRYFTAMIGDTLVDDAVRVSMITNSSDAAVVAVMSRLDVQDINSRLPTPDPQVMASSGVFTRDPMPLSDTPPRPTIAYRAAQLIAAGQTFDPPWQEALSKVRAGEIETWEQMHTAYPQIETMPPDIFDLIDDGAGGNAARYQAAVLRDSAREWNGHEAYVLSKIAQVGTIQSDLQEYLDGQYDVAPEVVDLIRRLPALRLFDADASAAEGAASGAAQNASNCTIQNGVRRCVVGGN